MPPKKQLSAEQSRALTQWIKDGAAWPEARSSVSLGKPSAKYEKLRKSTGPGSRLRPEAPVPSVEARILAARMTSTASSWRSSKGRASSRWRTPTQRSHPPRDVRPDRPAADARRRSTPSCRRVARRVREAWSIGCWRRRRSASAGAGTGSTWPATASRPARRGTSRIPHAWRYRDYVIDAFNDDKPYDQFIREQIAGDLLPARIAGRSATSN